MQRIHRVLSLLLLPLLMLSACSPAVSPAEQASDASADWQPADVRILDPLDSPASTLDLIAGYLRLSGMDFQIRLDLFENENPLDYDITVALDFLPGGDEVLPIDAGDGFGWDLIVKAPANHPPDLTVRAGLRLPDAQPRVVRDSFLDCIVLSLPAHVLSGVRQVNAMAWISRPDESGALDTLGPFRLEDAAPARAPLLLEFWDSLPAGTPAQLLRRWDGAHTGPYGQRHGLLHLLSAAQSNRIPLTLLDLAQPESIRGLQRVGGLDRVRQMQSVGLLSLPDNGYAVPAYAPVIAGYYRQAAGAAGLHTGEATLGVSQANRSPGLAYAVLKDSTHLQEDGDLRLIPILSTFTPSNGSAQTETIDKNGLTSAAIRRLLDSALSQDPADIVLLGGNLPDSPWGDLTVAEKAMRYIHGHPWIQPLSRMDLATFPALEEQGLHEILTCADDALCSGAAAPEAVLTPYGNRAASQIDSTGLAGQIYRNILQSQPDAFIDSAIEMLAARAPAVGDARLARLNASALTQAGFLIEASRWNHHPITQAQCDGDLDLDGYAECILSDETFFAVLDPEGGRLAFAAARSAGQVFQLIGPTSQVAAPGADSPDSWQPDLGTLADPAEIPGAFADPARDATVYTVKIGAGEIVFADSQRGTRRFGLHNGTLQIAVQDGSSSFQVPVFLSGLDSHGFESETNPDRIRWSLSTDSQAELTLQGAEIESADSVADSRSLLQTSENPNLAYASGHYLPFPFLIVNLRAGSDWTATISID